MPLQGTARPAPRTRPRAVPPSVEPKLAPAPQPALDLLDVFPAAVAAPPAPSICVILPVYNETRLIDRTLSAATDFAAANPSYTFLFADDGSADDTAERVRARIDDLAQTGHPAAEHIHLLSYPHNRGKGHAIRAAASHATAHGLNFPAGAGRGPDVILFTDGDLAYSLDHLPELVEALDAAEVAIGSRSLVHRDDRNTSLPRRVMGWVFNKLARLILSLPYKDTQAGLKGFRADAARAIFARQRLDGFAFDVELVFLARRLGCVIAEIPARVAEDHSDKTSKVKLLRDPLRMFLALLDIRWNALRGAYGPRATRAVTDDRAAAGL